MHGSTNIKYVAILEKPLGPIQWIH